MKNKFLERKKPAKALENKSKSCRKSIVPDAYAVCGNLSSGEDIGAGQQDEEALYHGGDFFQIVCENSLNQVIVIGPDTSVRYVNQPFEKLTGFSSDEIIGTKAPYPWWPEEPEEYFRFLLARNSNVWSQVTEKRLRKKNGDSLWVDLSMTAIAQDGVLNYLLVNFVDITERRQMQEKLIMQDRLASVGHLSSGLAHEINNPLTSVITFSSLLLQKELPDDVKDDIQMINDEAQRAARIVANLLGFVRKQPQEKQPVNINEVIQKAVELRAYEQKLNNIKVNVHLDPGLPVISGNSSRLQQVFINIIINAEFFMYQAHGKGTLTIKTEQAGNHIRVSFADNGPGISKDDLNRIFTPFFTTKEVGKGTGLGLNICRGIVIEHNGRIWAESKSGNGAVFSLELPVNITDNQDRVMVFEKTPAIP